MKRTCNGCKALEYRSYRYVCLLNYRMNQSTRNVTGGFSATTIDVAPAEECPKPLTNQAYVDLALKKGSNQ